MLPRFIRRLLATHIAAVLCLLAVPAHAVTIDMVTVGNPGNANDTIDAGYGAVNYEYQIGKYSVTIGQYTAFLNAADPTARTPTASTTRQWGLISTSPVFPKRLGPVPGRSIPSSTTAATAATVRSRM